MGARRDDADAQAVGTPGGVYQAAYPKYGASGGVAGIGSPFGGDLSTTGDPLLAATTLSGAISDTATSVAVVATAPLGALVEGAAIDRRLFETRNFSSRSQRYFCSHG